MIKKIFILILLFIILTPLNSYAENGVNIATQKWFSNFSKKISAKNTNQKEILFFEWFNDNLNELLAKKKLSDAQINLIYDLIKLSNEHIFDIKLEQNESLAKSNFSNNDLLSDFKHFSYNPENMFLENWVWYTYTYDKQLVFPKWETISKADLSYNKINPEISVVYLNPDWTLWFIIDYQKVKLITDNIIYWVADKYNLLKEIKDDKKKLNTETDDLFKKLKQDTINITKWKTKSLKIRWIYDYILSNIEYPKHFSLDDSRIFSGIDTYKNKLWVCEWYDKIFLYMLNFSYINNVEVDRWYVIDAQDFPKIWHAWVKIWSNYYDPTFDDPIWNAKTKKYEQYNFFSLPKDLFYTNRYDFINLPEYLKDKDMEFRKWVMNQKVIQLIPKYKNVWYNLLKPYILKLNNGIKADKKLDIEDLKKILWYYNVENLKFINNWKTKEITSLLYYVVDWIDIDHLLEQIEYNFDWYYLFKWKLDYWTYEYRLAYNVVVD